MKAMNKILMVLSFAVASLAVAPAMAECELSKSSAQQLVDGVNKAFLDEALKSSDFKFYYELVPGNEGLLIAALATEERSEGMGVIALVGTDELHLQKVAVDLEGQALRNKRNGKSVSFGYLMAKSGIQCL